MKKLFCIVIAIAMVAGLVACTSPTTSEAPSTEVSKTTSTEATVSETNAPTKVDFPEMTIRFSSCNSESSNEGMGILKFKELVEEATGGKVTVEPYFSSSLVAQDQQTIAVSKGTVEMAEYAFAGMYDWFDMMQSAYFFKDLEHKKAFYASDIAAELFDSVAEDCNVRYLSIYYNGLRTVNINEDRKVTKRSDLADIKLRMPNDTSSMFWGEALGSNPIPIAYADLYVSLQTGVVDGQDNAVGKIRADSFYEVTKSVTITGHVISSQLYIINDTLYQSMSQELQQIILGSAQEACNYVTQLYQDNYEADIAYLEGKGLKVYTLTDDELSAYSQEVKDYYFESEAGKKITANWDMDLYNSIQALAE